MKAQFIDEPELEFGGGRHVDIRYGLMDLGPLDHGSAGAPRKIRLGLVGSAATVEGTRRWLETCRECIEPKGSRLRHLFPAFPGFRPGTAFDSEVSSPSELHRKIGKRALKKIDDTDDLDEASKLAAEAFLHELDVLLESSTCDVVALCVPPELVRLRDRQRLAYLQSKGKKRHLDFHDFVKAASLSRARSRFSSCCPVPTEARCRRRPPG